MATAKKTSKKPVKKAAAKATSKASAAKTVPAKATKNKNSAKKVLTLASLYKLHIISAVASAVLAIASALLLVPASAQLIVSFMTNDSLANPGQVTLASASRVIWEPELRYLLAVIFAVSAIGSLLLATGLKSRYESAVINKTSGFRWLFVGISSALLLEFASIIAGIQDIATLKLIAALVLVTSLLSWFAERENRTGPGTKWLAYTIALVSGVLAMIPLIVSLIGTVVYGQERFSWYVYAFAGVLLLGFIGFALNLYRQIRGQKQWADYLFAERGYLAIDIAMKISAAAVIAVALHR